METMKKTYAVKKVTQQDEGRVYERLGTVILHGNGTSGVLFLELNGVKHELALFLKEPPKDNPNRWPRPAGSWKGSAA